MTEKELKGQQWAASDLADVPLRSEQIDEVLQSLPSSIVQWGLTIIFLMIAAITITSWFIKYPDLVVGQVDILSVNYPKSVQPKQSGRIFQVNVAEGAQVKSGQILAYLESTANPTEVERLSRVVRQLMMRVNSNDKSSFFGIDVPANLRVGELQNLYQTFFSTYAKAKVFRHHGTLEAKRRSLENDIDQLTLVKENLRSQIENSSNDLKVAEEEFKMNQLLRKENVISDSDMRIKKSNYYQKIHLHEQARQALHITEISKNAKIKELIELKELETTIDADLANAIVNLYSGLDNWYRQYALISSIEGRITYTIPVQVGQVVNSNDDLFFVTPVNGEYYGEMHVGQYNFGKVDVGQKVLIKLEGYPFQQYGTIMGVIYYVSDLPKSGKYLVKIRLGTTIITNTGFRVRPRSGLLATGEIITSDIRLLERILYDFIKILHR